MGQSSSSQRPNPSSRSANPSSQGPHFPLATPPSHPLRSFTNPLKRSLQTRVLKRFTRTLANAYTARKNAAQPILWRSNEKRKLPQTLSFQELIRRFHSITCFTICRGWRAECITLPEYTRVQLSLLELPLDRLVRHRCSMVWMTSDLRLFEHLPLAPCGLTKRRKQRGKRNDFLNLFLLGWDLQPT